MSKLLRAVFGSNGIAGHAALCLSLCYFLGYGAVCAEEQTTTRQDGGASGGSRADPRVFSPTLDGKWIGEGISYGPYREGQSPGGIDPFPEELAEDLHLLAKHWQLLRMYGSDGVTEDVLKIIHDEQLPLRVMLGAWIAGENEAEAPGNSASIAKQANQRQVAGAIRLANSYPEEVIAVSVGNECQVYWSGHKTRQEVLIQYIRAVREATSVPVASADDFNFWNKPESKPVAAEVDFIVAHIHAMWAGLPASKALQWTEDIYAELCQHHPEKTIVIGEAGWATQVHDEGEQAKLIKGEASEAQQRLYYRQFNAWARTKKICTFFFEAFDEPWKGGSHPNEVEKHWGLFRVDRTPKAALRDP